MPRRDLSLIDRLAEARTLRLWTGAAAGAHSVELASLRGLKDRARRLRRELDRVLTAADGRLALPLIGSNAMDRPLGADWLWRPSAWREPIAPRGIAGAENRTALAEGITLFHDCPLAEILLRQDRNRRPGDLAPFGLVLEVLGFDGKFLSLVVDLPAAAIEGLKRRHIIRADFDLETERALPVFARLNIRHGPNIEQVLGVVPVGGPHSSVDFDLATTSLNENRVEKLWLDLIFERPALNAIRVRDLTMSRRPRAEL